MFTAADNYIITIDPKFAGVPAVANLLLAGALAIDTIYKQG